MIELKNVSKYYQGKESVVKALDSISIRFDLGEFIVITGESGSGKSTFLNVLSGLDTYEAGEMTVNGQETSHFSDEEWEDYRRNTISFIFQNYNIIDAYTVYQNVDAALMVQGLPKVERKARVIELIERVGLFKQMHQKASRLSGGEKQRTAIARALAKDAPVIVADEPTGNLDSETSESIIKLLKEVSKDRLVLLVSHNYASKEPYATRHVRLFDGEIVEDRTVRPYEKPAEETTVHPDKKDRMSLPQQFLLSLRNMASMPKKSLFTFVISLFIVFVFAMTYGSYVEQTEATGMTSSHPNFSNSFEGRLVVARKDGGEFSEDELDSFSSYPSVKATVPNDPLLDRYFQIMINEDQGRYSRRVRVNHAATLSESDLSEGRLPENADEVVLDLEDYSLGETINIWQAQIWSGFSDGGGIIEATVVGLVESDHLYNRNIYYSDAFFQSDNAKVLALMHENALQISHSGTTFNFGFNRIVFDESAEVGTFTIHIRNEGRDEVPNGVNQYEGLIGETMTLSSYHLFDEETYTMDAEFKSVEDGVEGQYDDFLFIHPDTIVELFQDIGIHQVSLVTGDAFDARAIQDDLGDDYYSVYPAGYTNEFDAIMRTIIKIFLGGLSIFVLLLMYFIAYIALRNVMSSRSKNFVILRSIGARRRELSQSLIGELLFTMLVAFIVVIGVLSLEPYFPNFIPQYTRFFSFGNYLFMLIALMVLSVFLGFKFNKKIFQRSVISAFRDE